MEEINLRNYAYLGDAVWELHIRKKTIKLTDNSKKLHQITTSKVKMGFQAELLHLMGEFLTEYEHEIARRARNLPIPIARRSDQSVYRQATAFETLIGYWYLNDKIRLEFIFEEIEKSIEF